MMQPAKKPPAAPGELDFERNSWTPTIAAARAGIPVRTLYRLPARWRGSVPADGRASGPELHKSAGWPIRADLPILSIRFLQADVTASEMLYKAATLGDLATIETLLSAGVNPDLPDRYGQTPLCFAMQAGQTQVVELLLAWQANPNAPLNGQSRETPSICNPISQSTHGFDIDRRRR